MTTRAALGVVVAMLGVSSAYGQPAPLADHHQHLFSPEVAAAEGVKPITVNDL